MLTFKRDTAKPPAPCTWDYVVHAVPATGRPVLDDQIALTTCAKGHTCVVNRAVHTIIDNDGRLSPSYVCPIQGCGFHEWVRLDGWSWSWYNLNCSATRP